jgi:hypothetical protein
MRHNLSAPLHVALSGTPTWVAMLRCVSIHRFHGRPPSWFLSAARKPGGQDALQHMSIPLMPGGQNALQHMSIQLVPGGQGTACNAFCGLGVSWAKDHHSCDSALSETTLVLF